MKFGLNEQVVEQIIETLAGFPQIEEAIIYGSRAKGNYKPGSDIDLTLKGNSINLRVMNGISRKLHGLLIPYTVDLSIYHHIDDRDLLEHINRVGVVFYQASKVRIRTADENTLAKVSF